MTSDTARRRDPSTPKEPAVIPLTTTERVANKRREFMRVELASAARELFADRGFEPVTVEDIATRAGVATRTFYRYFRTKEDLVAAGWSTLVEAMASRIASRPPDESPLEAFRAAVVSPSYANDLLEEWAAITASSRALAIYVRGAMTERGRALLTDVFAHRLGVDPTVDGRPELWAAMCLGVTDVGTARLARLGGQRHERYAEVLDLMEALLTEGADRSPKRRILPPIRRRGAV